MLLKRLSSLQKKTRSVKRLLISATVLTRWYSSVKSFSTKTATNSTRQTKLQEALKGDDIEAIKAKQEELQTKFYEISEKLYKAAGGAQGFDPNNMGGAGFDPSNMGGAGAQGDNYTEAPFTDVD